MVASSKHDQRARASPENVCKISRGGKPMKYTVELARLVSGDVVSVRTLSLRRERQGALMGIGILAVAYLAAMSAVFLMARLLGRGVYAPEFFALWAAVAGVVSFAAYRRIARRLGSYQLGASLEADAFAPVDVDLVRRSGERFDLTVVPGMHGFIDGGRSPMALEALIDGKTRTLNLDGGARAEVHVGDATFVVQSQAEKVSRPESPGRLWRLVSRSGSLGAQVALAASLLAIVPRAVTIDDKTARGQSPRLTTPWEAEKWLRVEAQSQAASLYQCFDPLPLSCQHPGYVGVGVSLTRDGEMRDNWIARSTYGKDCPVDQCMKDVVSTWEFAPLPEPMRVVLPVQVLRTEKPLPKIAQAERGRGAAAWDQARER